MNWVDLVLIGVLCFSLSLGFQRGLLKQVITIGSVVLDIVLDGKYHAPLAGRIELAAFVESMGARAVSVCAYLGIFVMTLLGGQAFGHAVRRAIRAEPLGQIDSLFGALLGGAKACLLCGAVAFGVLEFVPAKDLRLEVNRSYLAPRLACTVREVFDRLPAEYRRGIDTFVRSQTSVAVAPAPAAERKSCAQAPASDARARRA